MNSYLTIKTALDVTTKRERKFHLVSIKGEDGLCRDFNYKLEICCTERLTETEIEQLVGNQVTVQINRNANTGQPNNRLINGVVFKLRELGLSRAPLMPDIWRYRLEISSWLKQLEMTKECRIFQKADNTSLKIITDLLNELGLRDFQVKTSGNYQNREYVTIYNESYYHFIIRLLQSEGILWYFEHSDTKHTLVFCDDLKELPEVKIEHINPQENFITFCQSHTAIPVRGFQTASFDYDNQPVKKVGKASTGSFNTFEYPGNFVTREDGEHRTSVVHKALNSESLLYDGSSTIRVLEGGKRFKLHAPALDNLHNQYFVIKELRIEAKEGSYTNSFLALPTSDSFFYLPSERLQKPKIAGNQTAIVVGSKNAANIHTDNQGRIMVRFHWDRHSPSDTGSAFIRNVTPAAGPKRGFVFIPNVDDEVVIAFEDGDPDRPLIIGRVYSGNQSLPVSPDSSPYQSIMQPRNVTGANRVLFDDKKGSESLEFRAKKDMNIKVGGSLSINIDNNLNAKAKNITTTTDGNFLTGNIISLSVKGINNTAGTRITNATGLAVANITGAVMDTKCGANDVNLALGMVNSSSGGATISQSPMILNTTAGDVEFSGNSKVKNKGLIIANTATELIENSAGGKLEQEAALAVLTKSKQERNKIGSKTTTKALLINDKAETAINDE